MNLWEINEKIANCFVYEDGVVDTETGEIFDADYLDQLEMDREQKIENICKYIKNLEDDAESYKKHKKHFADMQAKAENKKKNLEEYLANCLAGEKWSAKDKSVSVTYRKSTSVNVFDETKVPAKYLIEQKPKVDKTLIKSDIKAGQTVEGAEIVENNNMRVV